MTGPEDQLEFWDQRAPAWDEHADVVERFASRFGGPAMDRLGLRPGQHVADVGCGPGVTTLELGRRLGPDGSATGVEVSPRMVEAARARATAAGAANVRFDVADLGAGPLGPFDAAYSRFGSMFFPDPAAAFSNLARSIRPGGRYAATVWAELDANAWMFLPTLLGAEPLGTELSLPGPGEPGPFSLADPDHTARLLESSGFQDVELVRIEHDRTFDEAGAAAAVGEMLAVGPHGAAWAAAEPEVRAAAVDAVVAGCEAHREGSVFRLPAAAYVVSASVPE